MATVFFCSRDLCTTLLPTAAPQLEYRAGQALYRVDAASKQITTAKRFFGEHLPSARVVYIEAKTDKAIAPDTADFVVKCVSRRRRDADSELVANLALTSTGSASVALLAFYIASASKYYLAWRYEGATLTRTPPPPVSSRTSLEQWFTDMNVQDRFVASVLQASAAMYSQAIVQLDWKLANIIYVASMCWYKAIDFDNVVHLDADDPYVYDNSLVLDPFTSLVRVQVMALEQLANSPSVPPVLQRRLFAEIAARADACRMAEAQSYMCRSRIMHG